MHSIEPLIHHLYFFSNPLSHHLLLLLAQLIHPLLLLLCSFLLLSLLVLKHLVVEGTRWGFVMLTEEPLDVVS